MLESNKPNPYRFGAKKYVGDSKQGAEFKKKRAVHVFKRKVCFCCGQDVIGYVRVFKNSAGKLQCTHIRPNRTADPRLSQGESKRIADKLGKNEKAVKAKDGIIRVIEQ